MRKIEAQMVEAIVAKKRYSKGNTLVEVETDGTIKVYLHSNLIAEITKSEIWISDCGYQTKTTKSRINAILDGFNIRSRIYSKNHQWYIGEDEEWTNSKTFEIVKTEEEDEPDNVTTFQIPEHFMGLIFNGDEGYEEEDIKAWEQFEQRMIADGFTNGHWSYPDNYQSYFSWSNDVHTLGDNVVDLQWVDMST